MRLGGVVAEAPAERGRRTRSPSVVRFSLVSRKYMRRAAVGFPLYHVRLVILTASHATLSDLIKTATSLVSAAVHTF